jgi:hypothetical protein
VIELPLMYMLMNQGMLVLCVIMVRLSPHLIRYHLQRCERNLAIGTCALMAGVGILILVTLFNIVSFLL